MLKKTSVLTPPPLRAKTRISPIKAAASEEARRTLWYVEPLSDARTPLADFFSVLLALRGGIGLTDHRLGTGVVPAQLQVAAKGLD